VSKLIQDAKSTSYYKSSKKAKKRINEGRGQGVLEKYIPWNTTYDFSSKGRVTRTLGIKTGRIHQLQSNNQYFAFLIFEFSSDQVVDIRESYPLLDLMETVDSTNLRLDRFQDKETGEPYVITTNFLLTVKNDDGKEDFVARTVKNASELRRKITWERLEIERRYWKAKGISWRVITNNELSRKLAQNIEWVRETLIEENVRDIDKNRLSMLLFSELLDNDHLPLRHVLKLFEKKEGLESGTALFLFRYLLAKKDIRVNMNQEIKLSSKISDLVYYSEEG